MNEHDALIALVRWWDMYGDKVEQPPAGVSLGELFDEARDTLTEPTYTVDDVMAIHEKINRITDLVREMKNPAPMTTKDEDGNTWKLKLIGEDTSGHSIVIMLPVRKEEQCEIHITPV